MAMYKVNMIYPDGTTELEDDKFDTEGEAQEYGCYLCSCYELGGEILNMSNPGDYPLSDEKADFEIVEV